MHTDPPFDLTAALDQIDGDRELFAALADLFVTQAATDMAGIRMALAQGDSLEVMKRAHRLKGSAMQLHAAGLHEATKRLEDEARRGAMAEAADVARVVEDRLAGLIDALQREVNTP